MAIETQYWLGDDRKKNDFTVFITPNLSLNSLITFATDTAMVLRITDLSLPETTVGTYDFKYKNVKIKKSTGFRSNDNVFTFTVRCDSNWLVYSDIRLWMESNFTAHRGTNITNADTITQVTTGINNFLFGSDVKKDILIIGQNITELDVGNTVEEAYNNIVESSTVQNVITNLGKHAAWLFQGCLPINISGVEFSHSSGDPITFTVTMSYLNQNYYADIEVPI